MYYLNENLKELNRIFDQNKRRDYLRLDLNENPGGLPQEFIDEVLKNIEPQFLSQYPETLKFTQTLANHIGTDIDHLCVTNGSAEAIRYVIQAYTSVGGKIVGVIPSYFMFQIYAEMYGRNFIKIPYQMDLTMNVSDIIENLTEDIQLCVILNPNNPMGNVYSDKEFEMIMKACRENKITLLVDEAYHYFYPKTFIKYALNERHVFVTRTFSKLFSLAGCRLGYVAGHPDDIKYVQKLCTPHNTNAFALKFAEELLCREDLINGLISKFNEGRDYLIENLDRNGYKHIGDAGNFVFIKPRSDAYEIVEKMKLEKKILIKAYADVGEFGDCLRVSIGEKKYMDMFLQALFDLDR